jgi:hypothetical protein
MGPKYPLLRKSLGVGIMQFDHLLRCGLNRFDSVRIFDGRQS